MLTSFADNQHHRFPFDIFKLPQRESRRAAWSPLQISSYGSFVLYSLVSTSRSLAWQSCCTRACPLIPPTGRHIATLRAILSTHIVRRRPWRRCGLTTEGGMQKWLRQQQQPGWSALAARRVARPSPQALPRRRGPAGSHLLPLAVQQAPSIAAAPETARL